MATLREIQDKDRRDREALQAAERAKQGITITPPPRLPHPRRPPVNRMQDLRDAATATGRFIQRGFPSTTAQFRRSGEKIAEAAGGFEGADTAEQIGGAVGDVGREASLAMALTPGAFAEDLLSAPRIIGRGFNAMLGIEGTGSPFFTEGAQAADVGRPPDPANEPGAAADIQVAQADTPAEIPEVAQPPAAADPATQPVSLADPAATRVIDRPPSPDDRVEGVFGGPGELPPHGIEILRGTEPFFQDLSAEGSRPFAALPGQGFEASRRSAIASDPALQFLTQQDTSRLSAEANAVNAEANTLQAQTQARVIGFDADNKLRIFSPDEQGNLNVIEGITPLVEAMIHGPDEWEVFQEFNSETGVMQNVSHNNRTNQLVNLSQQLSMELAVEMFNRLVRDGEDEDDALAEAEATFFVTLDISQIP